MRLGLLLPHFGSAGSSALIADSARLAEESGFDSLWARDHLVYQPHGMEDPDATFFEGFATLAYAAAVTSSVSLGTAAAIPSRSPLQLAQLVATVTELSGRPFHLGLGAGYRDSEFDTTLLRGSTLRERATEVIPEIVSLLRAAWAGPFDHEGGRYSTRRVELLPRPAIQPAVWFGGTSPLSLRLAVQHCDGWMPGRITHHTLTRRLADVSLPERRAGREFAIAVIPLIAVGSSRADALAEIDVDGLLKYANEHRWILKADGAAFREPEDLAGLLLFGTPGDIIQQLSDYPAAGVTDVILDLRLVRDRVSSVLELIGAQVIPGIKASGVA